MAAATVILIAATAAFVYLRDPFQVLRPSSGSPDFSAVAQFQIPGIARHYPYDAVVTGTSTSSNFRPADLLSALGWHAVNLSIAGSTIAEQHAVLQTALATGKARHVLWGIDPFAFASSVGRPFPYYLYRAPGWRTAPYLLNIGAITHGLSTMVRPEARRTSFAQWTEHVAWDHQYHYGAAEVLTAWQHRDTVPAPDLPGTPALADQAVDTLLSSLVAANPDVQFRIVLLPYSILYPKLLLEERPGEFEAGYWLGRAIVRRVGALPNARVYDFRDAREITHNLEAFKDLLHFSGEVSRAIVYEVAADRRRATPEGFERASALIRADAVAYQIPRVR
jgi:hypothetical protein